MPTKAQPKVNVRDLSSLMKAALNTLSHPKTGEQLIIQTDSSMQGLACVMFQRDDNGEPHIITVASRSLKGPELNYSATEITRIKQKWMKWMFWRLN